MITIVSGQYSCYLLLRNQCSRVSLDINLLKGSKVLTMMPILLIFSKVHIYFFTNSSAKNVNAQLLYNYLAK